MAEPIGYRIQENGNEVAVHEMKKRAHQRNDKVCDIRNGSIV